MLKTLSGTVINNKMMKTTVVEVESYHRHPIYKKNIKRQKKYKAHDPKGMSQPGDIVKIKQSRPLSKTKNWEVVEVVSRKGIIEKPEKVETSGEVL